MTVPMRVLFLSPIGEKTRAIRSVLGEQPDMTVIDAAPCRGVELMLLLRQVEPDVLVLEAQPDQVPDSCDQVLGEYPDLTILTVGRDASFALHRLRIETVALAHTTLGSIAEDIRAAVE